MPRRLLSHNLSWRRVVRTAGPPVGTLLLSLAILSTALWIRNREQAVNINVSSVAPIGLSGKQVTRGRNKTTTAPEHVQTSSGTTTGGQHPLSSNAALKNHGSSSTGQGHAVGTSAKPGSSAHQSADVGFTPVSGGVVTTLTNAAPPSPTDVSAVVSQLGIHPTTTWTTSTVTGPGGSTLTIPSNLSPTSLLVLPLAKGVLWLQVQPTQIGPTGTLGPATSDTTLWYTPYPISGSQMLTAGAQQLGVVPAASTNPAALQSVAPSSDMLSVAAPPSFWYTPVGASSPSATTRTKTAGNSAGNSASTSAATQATNSTGSTSGAKGVTQGTASASTTNSASSSTALVYFYPAGLYQTSQGAVIALEAVSSTAPNMTSTWLYTWNEATTQLTPVTSLWNGNGTYSWYAVGTNVLYFGMRSVIPPSATRYSGHQYLYDTTKLTLTPIRIGTWTSDAYANGNQLVFEERNSTTWASFTPSGQP
ncbi:hypothetical protein [Alicyclobacillus sp. ALC3]|uniref:hypothetical protein n=1 Tax=Alicyclobacillus sp. ALC3 TaxID=2796143 RepID=UPI0023794E7C|nr:hypothetical protein [Alicyclobacillus sp. ALC3]WDL98076.1 hypothetical protein JC200_05065 [Alicyclobacillus sp. ALC3]